MSTSTRIRILNKQKDTLMTTTVNYTEQETKHLIDAYLADSTKDCI